MKLVVGLGNPGLEYEHTRHNIGFDVVKSLATRQSVKLKKGFFSPSCFVKTLCGDEVAILLMPTTFMNSSGQAVWKAMRRWKIEIHDLIVILDDVEIELGLLKVRTKGSAGTHNGLRSMIDWLQSDQFARLRVGVGPRPAGEQMIDFVLGRFRADEDLKVEKVVERAADAVESFFSIGPNLTMSRYNGCTLDDAVEGERR
ncbi:MAG: aminoacyl-tRNA hydrolase [Pontiellaceae bacterium]